MRKTGLILFLGLTISSCETPNVDRKNTGIIYTEGGLEIEEITLEGCQYIGIFSGSNCDWGTHKGNCNNPIHKQNKVTVVDTVEYKLIKE
jgi:hypothetical protein